MEMNAECDWLVQALQGAAYQRHIKHIKAQSALQVGEISICLSW